MTTVRDWGAWEREERLAFYIAKGRDFEARNPGKRPPGRILARWAQECNAHIERERARILRWQGPEAASLYEQMVATLKRAEAGDVPWDEFWRAKDRYWRYVMGEQASKTAEGQS